MLKSDFCCQSSLKTPHGEYTIYRLESLDQQGITRLDEIPYSIRTLLASLLRIHALDIATDEDILNLAKWSPDRTLRPEIPFRPARILMQDYSGVPSLVDLAALRSAIVKFGGDPEKINPLIPVDLVVDHSIQVDFFADPDALRRNSDLEFQRNRERYSFIKWAQKAFNNLRVTPPGTGIVHQVNLEYLSQVVLANEEAGNCLAYPDSVIGADSHTTSVNALGVVGWGVGGIEAEAIMLGQPYSIPSPDVIGLKLMGSLNEGVTATDLTLSITQILRQQGVVNTFVEFFGEGLDTLSLPDRIVIANMAPEYGANMCFFPVDEETLRYLRLTGRSHEIIERVEWFTKEQGLFRTQQSPHPQFSRVIELNLEQVEACLAGPKRPQDRVSLREIKTHFQKALKEPVSTCGYGLDEKAVTQTGIMGTNGGTIEIGHGAVVIAAITSCTNTSNPSLLIAAGLIARKALERGLTVKSYVKTSLAPGSRVVTEYLHQADLLEPLSRLGFNVVGYGCTTCIGNSGALPGEVVKAITSANLVATAVLSGSRNFEGRIHPLVRANFLTSPPLVVAYALAGTVDIDLDKEPLGRDPQGNPVYLHDIWPSNQEVQQVISDHVITDMYREKYANIFDANETWNNIPMVDGQLYPWDLESSYIREPSFFNDFIPAPSPISDICGARALAIFGDFITTDHISPAGSIPIDSPAGKYLSERGIAARDFNTYGSRRGNDQVMIRSIFSNLRLKNRMLPGIEGSFTLHQLDGEKMTIYDAITRYRQEGVPLVVIAGKEYGCGSSRDWAAKGIRLSGVRAVIAESFERIHRANLVGMGVLPLQFMPGENATRLELTGQETYTIEKLAEALVPYSIITVRISRPDNSTKTFQTQAQIFTTPEMTTLQNGGILPTILRNML